jgi:hypothetical protein
VEACATVQALGRKRKDRHGSSCSCRNKFQRATAQSYSPAPKTVSYSRRCHTAPRSSKVRPSSLCRPTLIEVDMPIRSAGLKWPTGIVAEARAFSLTRSSIGPHRLWSEHSQRPPPRRACHNPAVYRKLKPGRSGDGVRLGWGGRNRSSGRRRSPWRQYLEHD